MKAWILTAVLAVALIGGAALAVATDDGDQSDGTVAVGIADAGDVLVALTDDAANPQAQPLLIDRSSGVPVFATSVAFALGNMNELTDSKTPTRRQSTHSGKPSVTDSYRTMVALGRLDRSHPLLC